MNSSYFYILTVSLNLIFVLDSMAPGQTNLLGTKSFTGARYTAMGQTYNTTMSRIESEFAGEQTGKVLF